MSLFQEFAVQPEDEHFKTKHHQRADKAAKQKGRNKVHPMCKLEIQRLTKAKHIKKPI